MKAFVNLVDVIIIGTSLENHLKQLREIFTRLHKYNLKLQPTKCEFLRKEVIYLGHSITEGVRPDPKTIESVMKFPTPKNIKEVKSFLELARILSALHPKLQPDSQTSHKFTKKGCYIYLE